MQWDRALSRVLSRFRRSRGEGWRAGHLSLFGDMKSEHLVMGPKLCHSSKTEKRLTRVRRFGLVSIRAKAHFLRLRRCGVFRADANQMLHPAHKNFVLREG